MTRPLRRAIARQITQRLLLPLVRLRDTVEPVEPAHPATPVAPAEAPREVPQPRVPPFLPEQDVRVRTAVQAEGFVADVDLREPSVGALPFIEQIVCGDQMVYSRAIHPWEPYPLRRLVGVHVRPGVQIEVTIHIPGRFAPTTSRERIPETLQIRVAPGKPRKHPK